MVVRLWEKHLDTTVFCCWVWDSGHRYECNEANASFSFMQTSFSVQGPPDDDWHWKNRECVQVATKMSYSNKQRFFRDKSVKVYAL